jgi:hypothetical protein
MKKYSKIASIILFRVKGVFLEYANAAGSALRS